MNARTNKKKFGLAALLSAVMVIMAACQPANTPTQAPALNPTQAAQAAPTETPASPETATEALAEPEIRVATDPDLGEILVDGEGMTLYMFTKDEPDKSNCSGGCLQAWPPLLSQGSPVAGEGVDQSLLGTALFEGGRQIVTYNQMPLYYWQGDSRPGDTNGQDVNGVWYVVSPQGEAIGMSGSVPATGGDQAAVEPTVKVAEVAGLGEVLVDAKGMTLYIFTKDDPGKSNCTGGCLEAWPPLLVDGEPVAGEGIDPALLGTAPFEGGRQIVTYSQMPLYYWQGDAVPGDATGQNVNGVWFVVAPDGKPVGIEADMDTDY